MVPIDGLGHELHLGTERLSTSHREEIVAHVETGFEGNDLRTLSFHVEREVAGGRAEFQHSFAPQLDATEVRNFLPSEVPCPFHHPTVGKLEGVVPGDVVRIDVTPSPSDRLLEFRVQLTEVVARRIAREE